MQGFIDGYQTMDLLAGLYFGIVISANISSMGVEDEHDNRAETGIGGIFTGIMLAIIYAMLGFVGRSPVRIRQSMAPPIRAPPC